MESRRVGRKEAVGYTVESRQAGQNGGGRVHCGKWAGRTIGGGRVHCGK